MLGLAIGPIQYHLPTMASMAAPQSIPTMTPTMVMVVMLTPIPEEEAQDS